MERGSRVVECWTRNRDNPRSNALCCSFEVGAFSFFPRCPSSLSCINESLAMDGGGNVNE